jgi:signal transduction histidine kinase
MDNQAQETLNSRLLVVDDEENVAITVSEILRREGFAVDTSFSGEDAIQRLQSELYDLVVTDLHMEGLDGISVLSELHRRYPLTIAVVLTGFASLESAVASIRHGAYDYLVKPCIIDDLRLTIRRGLEHRRLLMAEQEAKRRLEGINAELERRVLQQTEELRIANTELQRHNEAKDVFLATLSHELRTPLTPIIGWTRLLLANPASSHLEKGLKAIERNALTQAKLIEDLLDVSRIITGKIDFSPERLDLRQTVESATENMRSKAAEKNLELALKIPPGPVWCMGVRVRLEQIIWNLISNSVKFTPSGGRISVSLAESADETLISVEDSGIGIPEDFLPFVFDRFRQGEGFPARKHEGLGLGLSIVRAFVELHRGRVWVHSDGRGRGATFFVAIPKATEPVRILESGASALLLANPTNAFEKLADGFQAVGFRLKIVQTVPDAVEFLSTTPPQAILLDMTLSESAAVAIQTQARDVLDLDVPLIGLSPALRDAEHRRHLLDLGFSDVLAASCAADDVLEAMRRLRQAARTSARPA